jgi:hypothetical protein
MNKYSVVKCSQRRSSSFHFKQQLTMERSRNVSSHRRRWVVKEQSGGMDNLHTVMAKRALHRIWTEEDTERLRAHIAGGGSLARATVIFGRTEQAVRAHAASIGLKFLTISELRRRARGSVPQIEARRLICNRGMRGSEALD